MTDAASRLENIKGRIADAASRAGRDASAVTLVAISKTHSVDDIVPLIEAGHRHFGENRVQEAEAKWPELRERYPDITLHMVGQLQSNKADDAVALFDQVHSVDRPSLIKALGKAMEKEDRTLPCFLQVNIGEEEQKGGCAIADLTDMLGRARDAGVPIEGLMAVPPLETEAAPYFALLRKLADDNGLDKLSMGMSADYETAVTLGATHVRVGSALFGERQAP